jgi:O-methyltransferase
LTESTSIPSRLLQALKWPLQKLALRVLRDVHRRLDELDLRLAIVETGLGPKRGRLVTLEERLLAVERRAIDLRRYALEEIAEYLQFAQIAGDYCEFGVAEGHAFVNAHELMGRSFPDMRFHAFDSFEGLPRPQGVDAQGAYTGAFHEGQFACSLDAFTGRLRSLQVPEAQVSIHKGWFDRTLAAGQPADAIETVAVAWVDCDLYESTVPVLNFLASRLKPGSVVVFDDWGCYRNQPDSGEQRACREWLDANPQLRLDPLFSYGWTGRVFTVSAAPTVDRSSPQS